MSFPSSYYREPHLKLRRYDFLLVGNDPIYDLINSKKWLIHLSFISCLIFFIQINTPISQGISSRNTWFYLRSVLVYFLFVCFFLFFCVFFFFALCYFYFSLLFLLYEGSKRLYKCILSINE